ncbi:MAG: TonB-dependent receptor [Bacteroidetes bacterium]|nr:TonB-dependent receptor [Bacteroidota bacterium]
MTIRFFKTFFLIVLLYTLSLSLNAQNKSSNSGTGSLSGVIVNSYTNAPLEYAYIVIYKAQDSTLVTGGISDVSGKYKIEKVPFGKYYLAINLIGHKAQKISNIFISPKEPDKIVDTIRLDQGAAILDAIEIKEKKQSVEYTLDKKVINVEKNLVSAGGSAVDVMQTIPSVTVDIDGNLSMRGSSNITVLIDGKPSTLTGSSRSAILDQIPASSIESVEIISNPSAKYDPDGMSGIINIILKKKKERGYHAVFTANAGTGDKYNGSISLNYSKNKINLFTNYDTRLNNSKGFSEMKRKTFLNDIDTTYLEQNGTSKRNSISHNVKLGADYLLNDKNSFSISAIYGYSNDVHSDNNKSKTFDFNKLLSDYYINSGKESGIENSFDYLFYYKKLFAKKGEYITLDASYSTSTETETCDQNIQYYNISDLITPADNTPELQNSDRIDKSNIGNIQLDYTNQLSVKSKLEAGYKSIFRSIDNDYIYKEFIYTSNLWQDTSLLSNHFLYQEQIHSAYTTYSNTIKKFEFQIGLRFEEALTNSTQRTTDQKYKKDYFSIFPTVHLNLKLVKDNSLQLSYSRRVNRPNYNMLNPFVEIPSPGILHYGNPYLTPEYIDSYELGHLKYWKKSSLNSSVFYKQINDAIQRYTYLDSNGFQNSTARNISKGISYGLEFVLSREFVKWWKVNATFSYFKTIMKGTTDGTDLTNSNYSWTAKLNSNTTIFKNLDIQLLGNYRAPMVTLQGSMKAMYFADIAIKKDLFKNKLNVTLRLSDIFKTMKFEMESSGSNFIIQNMRKRQSRVLYFGLTYKINGEAKTKEKKKMIENDNNAIDNSDF